MNSNNSQYFTNNFYINNVDRVIIPPSHQNLIKTPKEEIRIEDIMNVCHKNFRNILPNTINYNYDSKTILFPFEKNQIIELINQIDVCIQLLIQNLLLCPNPDIRLKTYNLLVEKFSARESLFEHFNKLPRYKVSLSTFKPQSSDNFSSILESNENGIKNENALHSNNNKLPLYFTISPQLSVFHSPLLSFIDKFKVIMKGNLSRDNILEVFYEFSPFINKHWIPIFNASSNPASRSKFSPIDDNLLLIGIKKYGAKDIEKIQKNFLPDKKNSEIRNRYKNLICTRAQENPIKKWKSLQIAPLSDEEKHSLTNGVKWYGSLQKTYVISKYFLPDRSPLFLEEEINNSEKLQKKRKKYGITPNPKDEEFFQSLKEYCNKLELNSEINHDQNKEKMEIENENHNQICEEDMNDPLCFFHKEKNLPTSLNYSFNEFERSQKGLKKMEIENEPDNNLSHPDENYQYLNFDKISLSLGDQEEDVEIFIDSKNNKTYKFVDDMTFECDEI